MAVLLLSPRSDVVIDQCLASPSLLVACVLTNTELVKFIFEIVDGVLRLELGPVRSVVVLGFAGGCVLL